MQLTTENEHQCLEEIATEKKEKRKYIDAEDHPYILKNSKSLLERIQDKEITEGEIRACREHYIKWRVNASGTIHNYPKRHIIFALFESYPEMFKDDVILEEGYKDHKLMMLDNLIVDKLVSNERINNSLDVIKFGRNILRGKEESENGCQTGNIINIEFVVKENIGVRGVEAMKKGSIEQ